MNVHQQPIAGCVVTFTDSDVVMGTVYPASLGRPHHIVIRDSKQREMRNPKVKLNRKISLRFLLNPFL